MRHKKENKENFVERMKNYFKSWQVYIKTNYLTILLKYAIFIVTFAILLTIDQVTKESYFYSIPDPSSSSGFQGDRSIVFDYGIIGFRSVAHHGVTIFSRFGQLSTAAFNFIHFTSILLFLFLLTVPLFVKSNLMIILCATVAAGDIGNFIDRMRFNNTVKDIIFSPFIEKWTSRELGTFNFADTYIVGAAILMAIVMLVKTFLLPNKEDLYEENMLSELLVDPVVLEQANAANQASNAQQNKA
ncbi:signal peptidase II [Mycoplasmopsis agalactiae]|nr:signal peptidase II [Mycoplasmopsis agalactiae]MCE6056237.1 signal peptidase II [Mycoplasmopsis agalactiae]